MKANRLTTFERTRKMSLELNCSQQLFLAKWQRQWLPEAIFASQVLIDLLDDCWFISWLFSRHSHGISELNVSSPANERRRSKNILICPFFIFDMRRLSGASATRHGGSSTAGNSIDRPWKYPPNDETNRIEWMTCNTSIVRIPKHSIAGKVGRKMSNNVNH